MLAAFLNSKGGTLLIGVGDGGEVIGLENDKFQNEDKFALHLDNLIKDQLGGAVFALNTRAQCERGRLRKYSTLSR